MDQTEQEVEPRRRDEPIRTFEGTRERHKAREHDKGAARKVQQHPYKAGDRTCHPLEQRQKRRPSPNAQAEGSGEPGRDDLGREQAGDRSRRRPEAVATSPFEASAVPLPRTREGCSA